jgi:hypothetical protein
MQTLIRAPAFSGPPSEADPEATAPALRTQSTIANTSRLPTALIPIEAIAVPPAIEPRLSPRALSFIAVVLLPIALVAAYLFLIAADQYVAEFRFSLNTVDSPRLDPLSLLAGGASHSPAAPRRKSSCSI